MSPTEIHPRDRRDRVKRHTSSAGAGEHPGGGSDAETVAGPGGEGCSTGWVEEAQDAPPPAAGPGEDVPRAEDAQRWLSFWRRVRACLGDPRARRVPF
ncbi:hypothetical protein GCM10027062_21700 [Nocardioides hungaricus]